jgi:hypothetical protein
LPGETILEIRDAMLRAFPQRSDVSTLFLAVNQTYEHYEFPNLSFRDSLVQVLKTASEEGWLPALLTHAHEVRGADPDLQRLALAFGRTRAQPIDYFRQRRLSGGYLMIDRDPLRDSMEELTGPLGQRILVVTGSGGSGKSHTRRLIWHLRDALGGFEVVDIDLEREARLLGPDQTFEPRHIAALLVVRLGYPGFTLAPPPDDKQWATWTLQFCNDLENRMRTDQQRRWIVIDAFNKITLTDEVLDLVKELAVRVGEQLSRVRLILVGLRHDLPPALRPTVRPDVPGQVGRRELAEFLLGYLAEVGCTLDDATRAQRCAELIQRVLHDLDPVQPGYLASVSDRLLVDLPQLTGAQP